MFHKRLKEARDKAPNPMTQVALASAIGRDQRHISRLERGEAEPRVADAMAICDALGIRFAWLIAGEGPMVGDVPDEAA